MVFFKELVFFKYIHTYISLKYISLKENKLKQIILGLTQYYYHTMILKIGGSEA